MEDDLRSKAIKVYDYLAHLISTRTRVVYDIDNYIDRVWIDQIPHHKWCYCRAWETTDDEGDTHWIEIKKPRLPSIPPVPSNCIPWVDSPTLTNRTSEPKLKERIAKEKNTDAGELFIEYLELADYPDVTDAWEKYLDKQWRPWKVEYDHAKQVQDIYSKLFSMYQQQKALGESYEVVIGLGLLGYKRGESARIFRHIITAQTELVFEPNKGTIVIKSGPEGAKLQFETEMIDPKEQPAVEIQLNLEERLKEISNEIWNNSLMHSVIRSWVNAFKPNAEYSDILTPMGELNDEPRSNFAPAIILRKRTERGILKFIKNILEQLKSGEGIPAHVRGLLTITEVEETGVDTPETPGEKKSGFKEPLNPLLPLQVNDEQLRIVHEIARRKGVLVQGPPGTGKSHTIANLICHLLSQGKRILVTSQTARALKVLKEKIPKQLQPLCVSVLGNRQTDFDNLKNSVNEITRKYFSWNSTTARDKVLKLEKELEDLKVKKQGIEVSLRELREKETIRHSIVDGKFNGTAPYIAQKIKQLESELGWIKDEIAADTPVPMQNEEFGRMLQLQEKITPEHSDELTRIRIKSSDILAPEEFVEMVDKEQRYHVKERHMDKDISLRLLYDKLKKTDSEKRRELLDVLRSLTNVISEARRRPLAWLNEAVESMLGDQDQPLRELAAITKKYITQLKEKVIAIDDVIVTLHSEFEVAKVMADAEDLLSHFEKGKKLGWAFFRPRIYKRIKYLIKDICVNGRLCDNVECLRQLIDYIKVDIGLHRLKEAWKTRIELPNGTRFNQVAVFSEQLEALNAILNIDQPLGDAKQAIHELGIIAVPSWHEASQIENIIQALEATFIVDIKVEIDSTLNRIKTLLKSLIATPGAHRVNKDFLDAIENRDWKKWGESFNELIGMEEDKRRQEELIRLLRKLRDKAPLLANSIGENSEHDTLKRPNPNFEAAWDWLRADAWLRAFEESHDEYELQKEFTDVQRKITATIYDLACVKSWFYCFDAMTEPQRQHLMAWSVAIQRLGKGTGKHAEKHRKNAQFHMNECRSAIPGWIMPLYRVADTIEPKPEIFDVVIVDEASQSGPEALFLFYIAKKCIIVGDDQQISPEGIGIERINVDLLADKFLRDIPHKDAFGPEGSLFSQAEIRFGARIVLREHFRCVPEIIQYSNNLCYTPLGHSLIPLREYAPERLEPVKLLYVREGYREGKGQRVINRPEARALAEQIVRCCRDKAYKNKTMGVISLQGDNQAKYVERLLLEGIGPEEMEKRALVCGNAYDFQGDERDIIFLSLVAAPNERIGVLAKNTDKRRFNVAVSRARDQIWLCHSATLNDLSPNCYRYNLLSYMQKPHRVEQDIDLDAFDSQFEKEVFLKVKERGYKVIPHFNVAEFEIDIVIEGQRSRLAVECDGEFWHGPEQFEHDMWRQRMLERSGWVFWRIRSSSFYRDPEQALEPLWQKLEEMGIYPIGRMVPVEVVVAQGPEDVAIEDAAPQPSEETSVDAPVSADSNLAESIDGNDRLAGTLDYARKLSRGRGGLDPDQVRKVIIGLLREGTQGADLLPDNVLRALSIKKRGRERRYLKRKIKRISLDMKREGAIEEYYTDKRTRLRLSSNQQYKLFS